MQPFKPQNLDDILRSHSQEVLTEKAIQKIEEEWEKKKEEWMQQERLE